MRVELQNVMVQWQGSAILQDVNLNLEPGQMVGVLGASGSGVSLLLKTAAGLMDAGAGRVIHDGRDLADLAGAESRRWQTRTGFMFQDAALWANTNLEGNLMLPLRAKFPDITPQDLRRRMAEGLEKASFHTDLSKRPAQISQGRQRFVSFLRATLPDPEVLFLDEPDNGLDPAWAGALWRRTAELRAAGTAVLVGGHRYDSWCEEADRLLVLDGKGAIHQGTPQEIKGTLPEVRS